MKKYVRILMMILLASCSASFADEVEASHVVRLDQLTELEAQHFFDDGIDSLLVEVCEGMSLPVEFFLNGEILELRQNDGADWDVNVKKTFYVKHDAKSFLFSSDLSNWYPLDVFITGEISVEVNVSEGYPHLRIGGEVNPRFD